MKLKFLISVFLFTMCLHSFAQKSPEPFVTGDRVVFAGNSITEAGFYATTTVYFSLYFTVCIIK